MIIINGKDYYTQDEVCDIIEFVKEHNVRIERCDGCIKFIKEVKLGENEEL